MFDDADIDRLWQELTDEFSDIRRQHQNDWGKLDDLIIARYATGECSDEEVQKIELELQSHPVAVEAVAVLRSILSAPVLLQETTSSNADAPMMFDDVAASTQELCRSVPGLARMIAIDDCLFDAVTLASKSAEGDRSTARSDAIFEHDRLVALAAGAGVTEVATSPLWFTALLAAPSRIWWSDAANNGPWTVRFGLLEQPPLFDLSSPQSELELPAEVIAKIPREQLVRWSIFRDGASQPIVQAAFQLLSQESADAVNHMVAAAESYRPGTDLWEHELGVAESLFSAGLLDDVLLKLIHLDELFSFGMYRFVIHRAIASVYGAAFHRLNEPPLWMGDREGLWASARASKYLKSAWQAIGIDYEE